MNDIKVGVVGLGYVGLPLACLLSNKFPVLGFDISAEKIKQLTAGVDSTGEVENLSQYTAITYTSSAGDLSQANFIIVAVPTPITKKHEPDLSALRSACELVGKYLQKGSVVVFESTVYPGCTEEVCIPLLEKHSGLQLGTDFGVGYSPERVNPGDKEHTIDKITKVVAGSDKQTLERVSAVYETITNVHRASSLKVAEAAKVIENVQRDLNIALMNELALIFDKMNISTREVIEAAATKWNFHAYYPGLVGGHCIGVDPYYLTHKAKELGHDPQVILAGRGVNESIAEHIAKKLEDKKRIAVLGVTFKENVPDTRNSKAKDLIEAMKNQGAEVSWYDPLVESGDEFGVKIIAWPTEQQFDGLVVVSPHVEIKNISIDQLRAACVQDPILFDVRGGIDKDAATQAGFTYLTL